MANDDYRPKKSSKPVKQQIMKHKEDSFERVEHIQDPQFREVVYDEEYLETEESFPNPDKYHEFPTFESFKIK